MANAPAFSTIYAFGDSLSDAGNLYTYSTTLGVPTPVSPPYSRQTYGAGATASSADVFSNGPVWIQNLSVSLGLGKLSPSRLDGTDFAYGTTVTGPAPQNPTSANLTEISLPSQLEQFEAAVPSPSPNALYTLAIGSTDVLDIISQPSLPSPAQQETDIATAVDNELNAVRELAFDGAKNLLVVDVPDLGKTPEVMQGLVDGSDQPLAGRDALASELAASYNEQLNTDLGAIAGADGLSLHILDAYQIYDALIADPAASGLADVSDPVWNGNFISANSGTLTTANPALQNGYLFFDPLNPTETGQSVIAAGAQAALAAAPVTSAPTFSAIYAFGDSFSDAGNALTSATSAPYFVETYAVGANTGSAAVFSNGPTWVQDLSLALGLGTLAPSGLGGTDFAYGGAYTGPTPENNNFPNGAASDLAAQLSNFQTTVTAPSPNALYKLWIGTNDIFNIAADPALTSSPAQQQADITASVNDEMNAVDELVHDGARNLLVVDVPDLGLIPALLNEQFEAPVIAQMCSDYNTQLNADLAAIAQTDALNLHIVDAFQIFDALASNPSEYGLINVTDPVWSGNFVSADSGTLASSNPVVQDQFLFFDDVHPTETVHTLIAADALDLLADPACFAAGARVLTQRGTIPVEAVREGDAAITHAGEAQCVQWIGRRGIDCRRHPRPDRVFPVRIVADAFGHGLPARDLRLSPDHAIFIYGALIPIHCLINGATVRQERLARVTYYHLELPTHAVILAEGLPVESYCDLGNRRAFDNASDAAAPRHQKACAELILGGPLLAAVRARLALQARLLGYAITDDPDLHLCLAGQTLRPDRAGAGYRFMLPPGIRSVRLRSRARVDARRLGIGVDEVLLDRRPIRTARLGRGWYPAAARSPRWTDGDAYINVYGSRELIVRAGASGSYWIDAPIERRSARR